MKSAIKILKRTSVEMRLKNITGKTNGRKEDWQLFQQCLALPLGLSF